MKTSQFFILIVFVAAIIAFGWQARTLNHLRTEMAGLRADLMSLSQAELEKPLPISSESDSDRREKMELIKLRNEVRELKEKIVESHARERSANVRAVMHSLLPTQSNAGPWNLRPEWKGMEARATNQYVQAMTRFTSATNDYVRYLNMNRAAKMSLAVGRADEARQLATDMLVLNDKYSRGNSMKSNGDAVHDCNMVLGRIAVDEGQVNEAKRRLLAAGQSTGSPVLNSFGPNMGLAKDLLEKGEQETVLQYFDLCRKFWRSDKLDEWTKEIQAGRIPEFGANLIY